MQHFKYTSFHKVLLSSLTFCHRRLKVLPQEVLLSESGDLTDLGRSYVPPHVLLEALYVVCSSASLWGDSSEAEHLAMEILIITHHPSIGIGQNPVSLLQTAPSHINVSPNPPQL